MEIIDDYLIIADLHIGVEDVLGLPFIDTSEVLMKKVERLLEASGASILVIAGDVRDGFDLNHRVLNKTKRFLEALSKLVDKIIIVRGNHDNFLRPIARKLNIERHEDSFAIGDTLITHGHKRPEAEFNRLIIGHIHPSVRIGNEVLPAKIIGEIEDKEIVILPAMTPIAKTRRGPTVDFSTPLERDIKIKYGVVEIRGKRLFLDRKLILHALL